ncbi:MAG: thiolase family protein [Betaproteobacteria bacterium]|nr:thiolase family protein [Betaproteobacteria bacterium]
MSQPRFAIIGTGEVPCGHYPNRNEFEIAYRVAKAAVDDAGITMKQVGAVVTAAHIMGSDYNTEMFFGRMPEAIGAKNCRVVATTVSGGASSFSTRKTAEGVLLSGDADYVLVVHAQRFSQFSANEQAKYFAVAGSDLEWEVPYGMTYNALAAMLTQGYMSSTGTTVEQIAAMCVACRKWANLQPNAMFRDKSITVEDVLKSRVVAWPLTALMCNVLADGGSAFVMTRADLAKKSQRPVYLLGEGSDYSHRSIVHSKWRDQGKMHEFFAPVARKAIHDSGIGPGDLDLFELYGSYPVILLMLMDALGIVEPGQSGALVAAGETSPGGRYPTTTNGEALGFGHTGTGVGFSVLVETIRQLQGKAGAAQVEGARFAIENCGGGAFMDIHFSVLGNQIPG